MDKKVEILIVKFLSKEANLEELRQLDLWINNPSNQILFNEYALANSLVNNSFEKFKGKNVKNIILRRIKEASRPQRMVFRSNNLFKYAAAIAVIALSTLVFVEYNSGKDKVIINPSIPIVTINKIETGSSKATLILGDGSVVSLDEGTAFKTQNANSTGQKLSYDTGKDNSIAKKVYNYLTIPRGGQYQVRLADGTEVWLNSESQLKFPVAFLDDEIREVELVYGEAYFQVSSSENHNGAKFKVVNSIQNVEVLGTEFNIKAYRDESHVYTTLVEGKVLVNTGKNVQLLLPNQQSDLDIVDRNIKVEQVDVASEISWKDGVFSFKGKPLKEIMKVISRWYDVDFIFENEELGNLKFKGVLDKTLEIEEILSIIKSTSINDYEIKNNTIIIN